MGLESLSDDLLIDILELLCLPRPEYMGQGKQRNDLLPFIRCCRRFYGLGEPILYRKLIQTGTKTLPRFIKTLLDHPVLADHLRSVQLTDRGSTLHRLETMELQDTELGEFTNDAINSPASMPAKFGLNTTSSQSKAKYFNCEEIETIEATILSLSLDLAHSWMEGIKDGSWDALAAFALCLLPSVEDLEIENCQDWRWQSLGPAKHTQNLLSHPFPFALKPTAKLRNLSVSYRSRICRRGLTAIPIEILALPSLHTFSGDSMHENFWENPADTKFSIKSLQLNRSNFSYISLAKLFWSCPELEYLKYEHDEESGECDFKPEVFGKDIEHLKDCLKELILYRTSQGPVRFATASNFGILETLKSFQKLTTLSITAQLLLGPQKIEGSRWYQVSAAYSAKSQPLHSCLPSSLEHLKLKDCGETIFKQVTGLIEVKRLVIPNLKSLVIEFVYIRIKAWGNRFPFGSKSMAVKQLKELCSENGVLFEVWYN